MIEGDAHYLTVYCQPGAKQNKIAGEFDGKIKIQLRALPVDGSANSELIRFLAKHWKLAQKNIVLVSGAKSRIKRLRISGISKTGMEQNGLVG